MDHFHNVRKMASEIYAYAPDARVLTTYYCGMISFLWNSNVLITCLFLDFSILLTFFPLNVCCSTHNVRSLCRVNIIYALVMLVHWSHYSTYGYFTMVQLLRNFIYLSVGPGDAPLAPTPFESFVKVPNLLRPHTQIYCTR